MSDDSSQLFVPPSFVALFVPEGRVKPTIPKADIAARYEVCEDLANALTDRASTVMFELGIAESDVLERIHGGLAGEGSGLAPSEAAWVTRRLAELMNWGDFLP